MATCFQILKGLPVFGSMAMPFPPNGETRYGEGFVVQFEAKDGHLWAGNFQRGYVRYDQVLLHPNNKLVIVIAGGNGYVINPYWPDKTYQFDDQISYAAYVPDKEAVVFGNDLGFEAWRADGVWWKSKRIAWDGMRGIAINGDELVGEAYSPIDDQWHSFTIDLVTGKSNDSIYEAQMSTAKRLS